MSVQEQLRDLLRRHHVTIVDQVGVMGDLFSRVAQGDAESAALIARILEIAHQLKGSSGSAGFGGVSDAAAALEAQLKAMRGAPSSPAQMDILRACLGALQQIAADAAPEKSTLYNIDLSRFRR